MAFQFADRVRVNTATTGTGTISLGTAVTGFRTFAAAVTAGSLSSGCSIYYAIEDTGGLWETGSGTYTAGSPDTLTRSVSASSAGGTTAITLSGSAQVYLTYTAVAVITSYISAGTIDNTVIGGTTPAAATFTTASFGSSTGAKLNLFSTTFGIGINTNELTLFHPAGTASGNFKLRTGSNGGTVYFATASDAGVVFSGTGSSSFAGGLTASTQAVDNNSTNVATTAFVLNQASAATPAALGTAAIGSSTRFARADHVHQIPTRNAIDQGTSALTSGTTIATNCANGNVFTLTLATNGTLSNPTNLQAGAHYMWIVKQDATGSRTLAYGSAFKWANASAGVLTTAANSVDIISAVSDGTNVFAVMSTNFA